MIYWVDFQRSSVNWNDTKKINIIKYIYLWHPFVVKSQTYRGCVKENNQKNVPNNFCQSEGSYHRLFVLNKFIRNVVKWRFADWKTNLKLWSFAPHQPLAILKMLLLRTLQKPLLSRFLDDRRMNFFFLVINKLGAAVAIK